MPLNASGVYLVSTAGQPVLAGTLIVDTVFNALIADIATALSTAVYKDGQQTMTANLPMGGYKLTGVGAGVARTDSATMANIQDGQPTYAIAGGTADAITLAPAPALTGFIAGQTIRYVQTATNTGTVTVNPSGLGIKDLTKNGTTPLVAGDLPAGALITITYDGTRYQLMTQAVPLTSPYMATVLDDTTAAAARTTLGALSTAAGTVTSTNILDGTIAGIDLADTVINDFTTVSIATGDYLAIADVSDSNKKKKALVSDIVSFAFAGTLTAGTPLVLNPLAQAVTTQAHGLGVVPKFLTLVLECLIADAEWVAGDLVDLGNMGSSVAANTGLTVSKTATNVILNSAVSMNIQQKTSNNSTAMTLANWKLTVTPYKLN